MTNILKYRNLWLNYSGLNLFCNPLTYIQMALLLPREIDVSIDKIQVSSLPSDHPLPEEAILSMCLEKCGQNSKLFKKECVLKKTASMDSSHGNCQFFRNFFLNMYIPITY
jgi:hypothetical protein